MAAGQLTASVAVAGVGDRVQGPSDAIYSAALLLIGRLYYRGNAPLGIASGFDLGGLYVRTRDPDVSALLVGRRGRAINAEQSWPDAAAVRDRYSIGDNIETARIDEAIAAVIDYLSTSTRSFGIA